MKPGRQYNSGTAIRTALEERLKRISREEAVDLQRLRRQVAFDRFLARLFQHGQTDWVLKGGYAMELRFHAARATKDLDFTVRAEPAGVLEHLQEAGTLELGDFFSFRIGEAVMGLDGLGCRRLLWTAGFCWLTQRCRQAFPQVRCGLVNALRTSPDLVNRR